MGCSASVDTRPEARAKAPQDRQDSSNSRNSNANSNSGVLPQAGVAPEAAPTGRPPAGPCAVERDPSPLAAVSKGITLRGLRKLRTRLQAFFGEAYASLSTADVNTGWVQVITSEHRCRLAELPEAVAPEDVGVPLYFISHAWKNRFELLLEGIEGFLRSAAEDTLVWVDIVAVNQHPSNFQKDDVAAFKDVVRASNGGTLVVLDMSTCNPATRAWCIYEWAATLAAHGPDGLHMPLNAADRVALVSCLDVEQAECFNPDDKVAILADVVAQHGSTAAFNDRLRMMLMLQPLSYRVDLRRLGERSRGTRWEFGAVKQWLGAGPGGPRVLCVLAGAGEGKSTISAALCGGAAAEEGLRDQVAAHHFVKYSDQRRLDPVRVVNSLAFQLADRLPQLRPHLFAANTVDLAATADPAVAFKHALQGPLARALPEDTPPDQQQQLVLLIDALDEADPPKPSPAPGATAAGLASSLPPAPPSVDVCGNKMFQLLVRQLKTLPRNVRFILTTRPDAMGDGIRAALDRAFRTNGGVTYLTPQQLRGGGEPTSAPASVHGGDDGGSTGDISGSGSDAAGGVLVYRTVVDECLQGGRASAPPLGHPGPPQLPDLYRVYGKVFAATMEAPVAAAAAGRPSGGDGVRGLLGVLLAAQEPLSQSLLHAMGLGASLERLPGYPVTFFLDEHHVYALHKSLVDWLADPRLSGPLVTDPLPGHARLAACLAASVRAAAATAPPYALRYLVRHLVACRDGPALDGLLRDYAFLAAAFGQGHGHGLIRDLLRAVAPSPLAADSQRWLLVQQHALVGVRSRGEMVTNALRSCPVGTEAFRAAQEAVLAEAAAAGRPRWRLRHGLGAPKSWAVQRSILQGHTAFVRGVAWSPDGRSLASGGDDKTVRLWDSASGECVSVLEGHLAGVRCVAWSPDGRILASSAADGSVRLWDSASGGCTATLEGHSAAVESVVWSPDGRTLASGGGEDKTVRLWDAASGVCTATLVHGDEVTGVAWSPDGKALASCGWDKVVRLWDALTGEWRITLEGHTDGVWSVAWRPDGSALASASKDRTVRLWDAASGDCTATFEDSRWASYSVSWRPDGTALACGSGDGFVRLWDAASGRCTAKLEGHDREATAVAWSPDGRSIASGSWDCSVRVWDAAAAAATGAAEAQQGHRHAVFSAAWRPDGGALASASKDGTLRLWDAASGQCTATLEGHQECVFSVAWSPDGAALASGSGDFTLRLWDAASGRCTATLVGHEESVSGVAWSPAGGLLASSSLDTTVRLWEPASGSCTATLAGHTEYVKCVAWSPDGRSLASGGDDKTVRLWDSVSGECVSVLEGHVAVVNSVAWSPDGRTLASGGSDRTVRLWDAASALCTATLEAHQAPVWTVAWSPDGRTLGSCSFDKTVRLWDPTTRECTTVLQGHPEIVMGLCWSPDGRALASSSWDRSVRVYDREE